MSSEKYNQIVDEAHKRYVAEMWFHPEDNWLDELDGMDLGTGEIKKVYRQYALKEFINKCKTNPEFSEKWGLKIEERRLSLEERAKWLQDNKGYDLLVGNLDHDHIREVVEEESPTKLITLTYNNETIESYE